MKAVLTKKQINMVLESKQQLVSIIIPTYNCGKYIRNALDSVLVQTHKNFEVIVIDDGSSDNTKELLKPYYDKINYISQKNTGVAKTRNRGIKIAEGEYIALIDADDIWLPDKLELCLMCFKIFPKIGMVCSDFTSFDDEGIIRSSAVKHYFSVFKDYNLDFDYIFSRKHKLDGDSCTIYSGDIHAKIFLGNIALPSTAVIRKECIDEIGLFNEEYRQNMEYDMFLKISTNYEIGYIDMPLVKFRYWAGNSSKKISYSRNMLEIAAITKNYVDENTDFVNSNRRLVRNRLARVFYELGIAYLYESNLNEANSNFIKSIKYNPFYFNSFIFFLVSSLPNRIYNFLRYYKRKLKKTRASKK